MTDELVAGLTAIVGASHLIVDPVIVAGYSRDVTDTYGEPALAVVRPADTAQVAAVLAACNDSIAPVVIQGGNTGLVGGGVPRSGEIVISLSRLNRISAVDPSSASVVVGAGVILSTLQAHVRDAGMEVPIDIGARDGATIGGMVATNAGGTYAIRHGMTRRHVLGLEVVLADGTVIDRLDRAMKDNTGLDLTGLIVGSEGMLAVVTAIRLGLVPRPRYRVAAMLGLSTMEEAVGLLGHLRLHVPSLEAVEFWEQPAMRLAIEDRGLPEPPVGTHPLYVLVQCADAVDPSRALMTALVAAGVEPDSVVVADTSQTRADLWRFRESVPDALNAHSPRKLDVSVPTRRLPELIDFLHQVAVDTPEVRVYLFGHLGDGNVHANMLGSPDEPFLEMVLRHVVGLGGSISAEHGLGVAKARYLGLTRTRPEIELMRGTKRLFDPVGILNSGRVLE